MAYAQPPRLSMTAPLMLLVPGQDEAQSESWLAGWEHTFAETQRLDLGLWDKPHRNTWVNKLNLAIDRAGRPLVVVAQGVACLTLAWWAEFERPGPQGPVMGALMIDPPDVDRPGTDPQLAAQVSCPRAPLPFSACLLASRGRGALALRSLRQLARDWDCMFDTLGTVSPPSLAAGSPVQTLGQRFLTGFFASSL